jgi:hypothetical protein
MLCCLPFTPSEVEGRLRVRSSTSLGMNGTSLELNGFRVLLSSPHLEQ